MSNISNDSFNFDDDEKFISDLNEELDYYALLNVPKNVIQFYLIKSNFLVINIFRLLLMKLKKHISSVV